MNWQPIETAPKIEDRRMLIYGSTWPGIVVAKWYDDGDGGFWMPVDGESFFTEKGLTHWMPLPEPPLKAT